MFAYHDTWFITCRTFQARKLMTPTTRLVRDVCGGVLAKAAAVCGVRLHAYAFLSNHLHLIVRAQGQQLARFMKYLLGNLSKKLGPLSKPEPGWWNRFWERRYTATPVLDDAALEERLRYVLAHGVKEGLVARIADWEGLHCAGQLVDEQPRHFPWFNWTRRWKERQRKGGVVSPRAGRYDPECAETVALELDPLPHWAREPPARRQQRMRELVAEVERQTAPSTPPLGMEKVRQQTTERCWRRKRSPRPQCHASTAEARSQFNAFYRAFEEAFRSAARKWLAGELGVEFPRGSFRPHVYEVRIV
jgi:REP element-mobilizing transposase RayT